MKRVNETIKASIVQVILIVFSVVLGLYLSERIEESKNRQASEDLLQAVTAEVKDNRQLLQDWLPYHQEIKETLYNLLGDDVFIEAFVEDKSTLFNELMTRESFMGRLPASDAWDIAKSHPRIVNIDYDKLVILSRVYSQQKNTFDPLFEMFELLNSKNVNKAEEAKLNLEVMSSQLHELVAREEELLRYFNTAATTLGLEK